MDAGAEIRDLQRQIDDLSRRLQQAQAGSADLGPTEGASTPAATDGDLPWSAPTARPRRAGRLVAIVATLGVVLSLLLVAASWQADATVDQPEGPAAAGPDASEPTVTTVSTPEPTVTTVSTPETTAPTSVDAGRGTPPAVTNVQPGTPATPGEGAPAPVGAPAAEVRVEAGDSFWRLADGHLADALGRAPTVAEIASYSQELIAANADQLVTPGNPDLILPGQLLELPPPSVPVGSG